MSVEISVCPDLRHSLESIEYRLKNFADSVRHTLSNLGRRTLDSGVGWGGGLERRLYRPCTNHFRTSGNTPHILDSTISRISAYPELSSANLNSAKRIYFAKFCIQVGIPEPRTFYFMVDVFGAKVNVVVG